MIQPRDEMEIGKQVLYLSSAEVEACAISRAEVETAVERMFAAKACGQVVSRPKVSLLMTPDTVFLDMGGGLGAGSYAGMKWVGVRSANRPQGQPHFTGLVVLNDADTGVPLLVCEATWITGVRTAAITAVAARRLARRDSSAVGFIAAGFQARMHLAALREHFPIARVCAYSRRPETAAAFAAEVRGHGLEAESTEDPRLAVENMDIVITSVPLLPRVEPFLDPAWLAPGSFASMVDLGYSWMPVGLAALDRVVADDLAQGTVEKLNYPATFHGEVAQLVAGTCPGRLSEEERTALIFDGLGLTDVAVAAVVYERAVTKGLGRLLPL